MTTTQIYIFTALYLVLLIMVAWLTRPTARRFAGALAGGAAIGLVGIGMIALGERAGWWHFAISWSIGYVLIFYLGFVISATPIYLMTWRIARRFGLRGLIVVGGLFAVLGPVRDYRFMATFPEWGSYAPGPAPALAISAIYLLILIVGHPVMWSVAGPSPRSPLATWPWEAARTAK
jgi:hypothetical protein